MLSRIWDMMLFGASVYLTVNSLGECDNSISFVKLNELTEISSEVDYILNIFKWASNLSVGKYPTPMTEKFRHSYWVLFI